MSVPISIIFKPNHFDNDDEYYFDLSLTLKNGIRKEIKKTSNKKYISLFGSKLKIEYDEIKIINLNVTINNDKNINICEVIDGLFPSKIDKTEDSIIYNGDDIYFEFIKEGKYCVCNMYLTNQNTNNIFFTPPNY
jgi:hypothetical protein